MNKLNYILIAFLLSTAVAFAQAAGADLIPSSSLTNTSVKNIAPAYSSTVDFGYVEGDVNYLMLPASFTETNCLGSSCTSRSGGYDILESGSYGASCETAAERAGLADATYTCSVNAYGFGFYCVEPEADGIPSYCFVGYGDTIGGGGSYRGNGFKDRYITEVYPGVQTAASSCKPFPNEWNTQSPYYPNYTYLDSLSDKVYRSTSCTTTVHYATPQVPVATLTASPSSIVAGNSSGLTYSCSNESTSATIDQGVGAVTPAAAGTVSVTPTANTTYTLTCSNAAGSATATTTVAVTPALTASCNVSPATITAGGSATWSATATGGTGAYTYSWSGTDSLSGATQLVAKTYATAGTKSGSVTVTSGSQTVTQACSNTVTVSPGAQADLTAGAITPTSATAGQAVTLSATATNIGVATSGSFPLLFQVQSPATLKNSSYLAAIAANASRAGSVSHTFASPGSYQVRACANYNTSWTAIVTESNYDNNCGPWTTITVAESEPSGTLSCQVSNDNPAIGQAVTYTASGAPAPYTWTPADGVGSYGTGSTANRTFSANGSYGMTVSKSGYTSGNCPVVLVGEPGCGTADATITATPDRVRADNNTGVTLNFSASGVDTSCTISGPGVSQTVTPNACLVGSQNIQTPQITEQSVYRINCDSGESVEEVVVNLIPRFDEF